MIDPKSLRIGNYIQKDGGLVWEVSGVFAGNNTVVVTSHNIHFTLPISEFSGIPLSEQELIRLGFHKESDTLFTYGNNDTSLCLTARSTGGFKDGGYFLGIRYDDWDQDPINIHNFIFDIKFVHRLQNAFDDMDIELTYPTEPDTKEAKQ